MNGRDINDAHTCTDTDAPPVPFPFYKSPLRGTRAAAKKAHRFLRTLPTIEEADETGVEAHKYTTRVKSKSKGGRGVRALLDLDELKESEDEDEGVHVEGWDEETTLVALLQDE